jgi:hypothetical protein
MEWNLGVKIGEMMPEARVASTHRRYIAGVSSSVTPQT